jgi:TatD DNase family protein
MLVDTHCHLDFDSFTADRSEVLSRAVQAGVEQMITIGIDIPTSWRAVALAEANEGVFATVGIHPHNSGNLSSNDIEQLLALARNSQVVAYGEIGLDYYRNYQPRPLQLSCLKEQLDLARQLELPVVLHDRDAHEDILQVLQEARAWEIGGTMHCFSGDWSFARRCLDLGFYISIAGPVTFAKSDTLRQVASECPLDRLLLETDAPFLTPVPKRGKRNEPAFLVYTAEEIASLRKLSFEEVGRETTLNARNLFQLPEPLKVQKEEKNGL